MGNSPRHVYLVDGSAYIFRAFHALPPMTRPDGVPVNAVFGFTTMVTKLVEETDADFLGVIFDAKRINFRNEIYPDYKGHRPDAPEELIPQFALIRDAVRAFDMPCVEQEGYEADDLIATYAKLAVEQGAEVTIVSSDKDLMQLIRPGVTMWDPMKNKSIGPDEVMEKFGVGPEKVVDVQALAGDSTDNVPGVPGIGVKTAAQLLGEYGDLETLLARASEIKQPKRREALIENAELARISKQLVTLKDDVPLDVPLSDLVRKDPDPAKVLPFLRENAFRKLVARWEHEAGGSEAKAALPVEKARATGEKEYSLVVEEAELEAWVAAATKAGRVAVDTETTNLDATLAELVGISLCVEPGRACYIPVGHTGKESQGDLLGGGAEEAPKQIAKRRALEILKPMLEDESVLKIGQNIKYDLSIFARQDPSIAVAPIDDTMLISFALDAGLHGHGMDELAELHLDWKTIHYADVAGKGKDQVTFDKVPLEAARDYAAEDADVTLRLYEVLKPRLLEQKQTGFYELVERPLPPVVAAMEREGIKADPAVLRGLSEDFAKRLVVLEGEIHQLAGREFNVASPKQLGEILFDEMGISGGKKTKSGTYSTDSAVLEPLALEHPIAAKVLDWRQLAKLKSTYADALIGQINPRTGRVHTAFMMAGAQTGRLSSTDPNLQNIPVRTAEGRKIREAFVAEPGHKLLSLDYSQIELRLMAELGNVAAMRQAFADGLDIHAATASQVFGVPVEGMPGETRRRAKAINFGIIYGISAFGLAKQIGVPQSEAKAFINQYFERFPEIHAFMEGAKEFCREHGYVETLMGRRIHLPGIKASNPMQRNYAERQAINAPLQGTAADIIKRAMARIPAAIAKSGLKARMLLQVHDELLFELPEGEVERAIPILQEVMQGAAGPGWQLSVPLVVEAGVGSNWNEAH